MSEQDTLHGLACPRCGGMVPIPEGQVIVKCPFCDLRSVVRGERGIQRYQVPLRIQRQQALDALQRFLRSHFAIAMNASRRSQVSEAFVVYLPFWASWTRALGWVFGKKKAQSGKQTTYKPREVRVTQDMTWNGAACDVGEFGVESVPLSEQALEPFDPVTLHDSGLVFEPVGSATDAKAAAEQDFSNRLREAAKLDKIDQVFVRLLRWRAGLVYYPLWVLRYIYRQRSFQVVVDGCSGKVLYGKAPGNSLYRAAVLVGGMAAGALLAIDGAAACWYLASQSEGDSSMALLIGGVVVLGIGFGLMATAYRLFRYGEHYEYRFGAKPTTLKIDLSKISAQIEEISSWTDQ